METHTPVGKRRPSGKWDHRPLRAGVFLTFEGIDCSGKSIQASRMHDQLKKLDLPVMLIRDPGGTVISEKIRSLLLDRSHHAMDPLTEMFLYEAARTQMVAEIIKPALMRNEIVLCDRFTDSTICYQGYGRALSLHMIRQANEWSSMGVKPDRTYVLDIDYEESLLRRKAASRPADRMEKELAHFFEKVRQGYHMLSSEEPERIRLLNGSQTVEKLEQEILKDVLYYIDHLSEHKSI